MMERKLFYWWVIKDIDFNPFSTDGTFHFEKKDENIYFPTFCLKGISTFVVYSHWVPQRYDYIKNRRKSFLTPPIFL